MNRNRGKFAAGMLAAAVMIQGTGLTPICVYAETKTEETETKESKSGENETKEAEESVEKETGKEEVVYVSTDAQGAVESVNVVNIFGKGSVTDYGSYSAVKMLNTTDAITQDGDQITFSTDLDKVYYQGTLEDAQIPWLITVSYTLDGKEISPEDLAGKSGALKIHFKIEKNKACKSDFYDSYALQAALTLDTERCKSIRADGATMANVGADKQISYTVLPGKGLDAEISADVTDFEMDAVSINGIKLNLNIEVQDADLMDQVDELMDAAKKINDGAGDLFDGAAELSDGANDLSDGASSLDEGINTLNDGINTLNDGVLSMQEALDTLNAQSGTLTGGSAQILDALRTIQAQLSGVSVTTDQLTQLTQSSAAILQGIANASNGAAALQGAVTRDGYKAAMNNGGLDIDQLQAGNTEAINTLTAQIQTLSASLEQIKSIPGYESDPTYAAQAAQLETQISSLNTVAALLGGNNAAIDGTMQYFDAVSGNAASLTAGLTQLQGSYQEFDAAIQNMAASLSGLAANVSQLKTGINQLTESYTGLDSGIGSYTAGVASIVEAYGQITEGTEALVSGCSELVSGSADLKQGASDLYDGTVELKDGADELSDGTGEFYEKTDGMDVKIEDTVNDMLDSITGGDSEPVSFVSDKNKNVESVQFVMKTEAVKKPEEELPEEETAEEQTVWEKFLGLFGLD